MSLSTQVYKMGTGDIYFRGKPCDGLVSYPGGVAILSVASCYRNRVTEFGHVWASLACVRLYLTFTKKFKLNFPDKISKFHLGKQYNADQIQWSPNLRTPACYWRNISLTRMARFRTKSTSFYGQSMVNWALFILIFQSAWLNPKLKGQCKEKLQSILNRKLIRCATHVTRERQLLDEAFDHWCWPKASSVWSKVTYV